LQEDEASLLERADKAMILFYFLIFVLPLSQHHIWAQFVGDLTGIKYIGIVCVPYAIFHLAQRKTLPRFLASWQARFFFVLYIFVSFSFLVLSQSSLNSSHWVSYTSFLAFFFITASVVDTRSRMRWVVLSGIGSIGLASVYVLRDWQLYHNLYAGYRPGWVVGDPNYFTVNALLFMPVALLLLQQKQPGWQRLFCLGCLILTSAAVALSASRGGFLGLVASCLYFLLKSRHRGRNFALVCAGLAVLALPLQISPVQRLFHPTQSDEDAQQIRLALWDGGLKMVAAHPFFGVGLDDYPREITKYVDPAKVPKYETVRRVAHNSYMEIAAEMGVPALFIFLGIIISSVFSLERVRRVALKSNDEFLGRVALGMQAGILGASVALFFVSGEYQKIFWMAIFLTTCLPAMVRSKSTEVSAAVSAPGKNMDRLVPARLEQTPG
jgi:O-antigen ligase